MFSDTTIRTIAEVFIGDSEEKYYSYKSAPQIINFLNNNFGYNDTYYQGFPSRWLYTSDRIKDLLNRNQFNKFINIILSKNFVMRDNNFSEVDALSRIENVVAYLNKELDMDGYKLLKKEQTYLLIPKNKDLRYIGEGGFAEVYESLSTGNIIKILKDDFKIDKSIKHRFKREYEITKSLSDLPGIIKVYQFDDSDYSYSMEKGEMTLEDFINNNDFPESTKITIIRQIIYIMKDVHTRNIIHRDISPNNILLFHGQFKICDFGLGKDLDMLHSHRTMKTQGIGQYYYCAPEQFMKLREGDKRSDVFSLGSLINFIMTRDPRNNRHFLRYPIEKAKSENPEMRYEDAGSLLKGVEEIMKLNENNNREKGIKLKIANRVFDEDVKSYIYSLNGLERCKNIISLPNMGSIILKFILEDYNRQQEIIELIEKNYLNACNTWADYDKFGDIAYEVIFNRLSYVAQEISARILYNVAYKKNRFSMQRKVRSLIDDGIEPSIEEILTGERE